MGWDTNCSGDVCRRWVDGWMIIPSSHSIQPDREAERERDETDKTKRRSTQPGRRVFQPPVRLLRSPVESVLRKPLSESQLSRPCTRCSTAAPNRLIVPCRMECARASPSHAVWVDPGSRLFLLSQLHRAYARFSSLRRASPRLASHLQRKSEHGLKLPAVLFESL
jgi:hypothetical protein